tara:strand:- start:788 stop:1249 length:462 start_codon:yes stop_codon:yes gene_type:complete
MSDYKTKVQKRFAYHGAGYEVVLHNVPMIKLGSEWVLNINPGVIDRLIFEGLPHHPSRLTGSQVRFVRALTGMTLKAFADRFGVSHPAVKKWENAGDGPTNMSWSTEKDIRLFVLDHGDAEPQDFQACYNELAVEVSGSPTPVHVDIERMAVA